MKFSRCGLMVFVICTAVQGLEDTCVSNCHEKQVNKTNRDIMKLIDRFSGKRSVSLLGGLMSIEWFADESRGAVNEPSDRVSDFLRTHSLRLHLPTSQHVDLNLRGLQARGKKVRKYLLPLILALQIKTILALPLFLLVSALMGLKTLGTSVLAAIFSGAALLRTLLGNNRPGGGSSSRVSYEVKQPQSTPIGAATPIFNSAAVIAPADQFYPYYIPPAGVAATAGPEYKIFSSASNDRRRK